jgi:hypothetical protein
MMSVQSLQITPPESFTSSPPTPPATWEKSVPSISRILAEVKRRKDGYCLTAGEHWLRFSLDVNQYEDLQRKYNLWDHYEYKLR